MKESISRIVTLCSKALMSDDLKGLPIHKERFTEILHLACDAGQKMGLQAFYKMLAPHENITVNCEYFCEKENEWLPVPFETIGYKSMVPFPVGTKVRMKLFESYGPDLQRQDVIINQDETEL